MTADLIAVDKNGYLTEVEIKRSFEDFKADFKKDNYHDTDERVFRFGYFVPKSILKECIEYNSEHCKDATSSNTQRFAKPEFNEFPTQSPVCRGNDGLPFRVADLTISFAKWRSKSIEALGNAWVPQVAFEIFKAIEENYKNNKAHEEDTF